MTRVLFFDQAFDARDDLVLVLDGCIRLSEEQRAIEHGYATLVVTQLGNRGRVRQAITKAILERLAMLLLTFLARLVEFVDARFDVFLLQLASFELLPNLA